MKVYTFNCPNCGSPINLDYDNPQSFCGSCGTKILLDISQLQDFLIEKERTKLETEKTRQEVEKSRQANEHTKQSVEMTKQRTEKYSALKIIVPLAILGVLDLGFMIFCAILFAE